MTAGLAGTTRPTANAILREAELPVEAVSGPYGGYRAGRGLRLPPLMFSAAEAMGLVMAVLEGHRYAADPGDLVGGALAFAENRMGVDQILAVRPDDTGRGFVEPSRRAWER